MIASISNIVVKKIPTLTDRQLRDHARTNCQIRIPRTQLGTFKMTARFPLLHQDYALEIHFFDSLHFGKYHSQDWFLSAGETGFTVIPDDEGFFEGSGDGNVMCPDGIAIFSHDGDISSVHIQIWPIVPDSESFFLHPRTMD